MKKFETLLLRANLVFFISLLLAFSVQAQSNVISISVNQQSLSQVLKSIENQSDYLFFYNTNDVEASKKVTINVNNATIQEVLDALTAVTGLTCLVKDKHIVLTPISKFNKNIIPEANVVTGVIRDNKGETLPAVNVIVKGTTIGVLADINGQYRINLPENIKDPVLRFVFLGYQEEEQAVGRQNVMDIVLMVDVSRLEEVVVVGYGTQKKVNLTGAVSSVKSEAIVASKNENVQNMLTGKVAGLRVVQTTSEPGQFNNSFDIRGLGAPLIVIDGIARDNMSRLDPNDIESLSVLKDASAAIYGVRAANGVVLITTKKGKSGKLELIYNGNYGLQMPSGAPKTINAIDFMSLVNERSMHNVNGGRLTYSDADFEPYLNGTKKSFNWYEAVYRDVVPQSSHNVSATGGSDKINYFFSLGYANQQGFFRSGDLNYKRYNVRSNISSELKKGLTLDLNINGIMDTKNQPYESADWINRALWRQLPIETPYANNNPNFLYHTETEGNNAIAMSTSEITGYKRFTNRWFQSSISLSYLIPFVKGLQAKGMFSYDYYASDNKAYKKSYNQYRYNEQNNTYDIRSDRNSPSTIRREYFSKPSNLLQTSLIYDNVLANHQIGILMLFEQSVREVDNFYAQRELSLPVDQLLSGNSLKQEGYMKSDNLSKDVNKGLIGRVNYGYDNRYLLELSFRYDGSSKFPKNKQWGFFPSASVGWRVSEEPFAKNSTTFNFVNNLKVRASYGKLGDDGASSYQFITGYSYPGDGENNKRPSGSVFDGSFVTGAQTKGIANHNITWYVSKTLDLGFDLDMWKGLLGVTFDVFSRDRTGLLTKRSESLPSVVGALLPEENLNGDRTQGLEFELNHRKQIGEFNYYAKAVFSYTRTKNTYMERARAGNSYGNWRNNTNDRYNAIWFGYGAAGRYLSYADIVNSPTFVSKDRLPGDYGYFDYNEDGEINDLDKYPIAFNGNKNKPLINYGVTLGASYKNFDLNILIQGAALTHQSYIEQLRIPLWGGGALEQFTDRWRPVDPKADPYNPNTEWISGNFGYTGSEPDENSVYNIQNASYVRLKNIELGYTLPQNITMKIGIQSVRFYSNAYNLLTVTSLKYMDPEHSSESYGYIYPLNKTVSFGVNVKF